MLRTAPMKELLPLFDHSLEAPTAFTPEALVDAVRADRRLSSEPIPQVCVLEFDGDLTDWLVSTGAAKPCRSWACFHTSMFSLEVDGTACGIVPRTIGGPYAVLVAEQMAVSGARVVLGLTSAGRVSPSMPVPGLVSVTKAVRDEGTSYHYLSPAATVDAPPEVAKLLESELRKQSLPVLSGAVWTTDAPYRETKVQLAGHSQAGVLAVEMQAASLFAFSAAHRFPVGVAAHVTNSSSREGKAFDKGAHELGVAILEAVCRAGMRFISSSNEAHDEA
ncbi:MAG: nucleoside phosphorylase [Nitrososphaerota archaeon]|nr:nucleoside phosphorylase [Nitrososphaerota archaeon]